MRKFALFLALGSLAGPALADPLSDALSKAGGTLCFTRSYDSAWLKAHRGQTIREVRFTLTDDATLRMSLRGAGKAIYIYGACGWYAGDLNRGVQDNILDPTFKPTTGVGCHAMTDTTGVSAEEGGDFPVEWGHGNYVQVHLDGGVAGWRSADASKPVSWPKLGRADSIFRLNRAPASACRELISKFAPN